MKIEIANEIQNETVYIPIFQFNGNEIKCPFCHHLVSPDDFSFDDLDPCQHVEFIFGDAEVSYYAREDRENIDLGISHLASIINKDPACKKIRYSELLLNFLAVDKNRKMIKLDDGIYNELYFSFYPDSDY